MENSLYKLILKVSLVRRPRSGRRTSETLQRIRRESAYAVVNSSLREASRSRLALSRFPFSCYSGFKKIEKLLKNCPLSKKNRPPWDPPGGPKSLLGAKKSLLDMKIGASDTFWRSMIDF